MGKMRKAVEKSLDDNAETDKSFGKMNKRIEKKAQGLKIYSLTEVLPKTRTFC